MMRSKENENFLTMVISKYQPYWPLFTVIAVVFLALGWGYLNFVNPVYESTARILIKDEKKGAEDSKTEEGLNLLSPKKIIENETEVIQSRTLVESVVEDLDLSITIMEDRWYKTYPAYVSSPIRIKAFSQASEPFPGKIYFTCPGNGQSVILGGTGYPLDHWVKTNYGKLKFIRNPNADGTSSPWPLYFQFIDTKAVVSALQSRLKVSTTSKQSSILTISLRDESSKRADDILNRLIYFYNDAIRVDKSTLAANTLASVEERLHSLERELDSIERKAGQYKSRKGAVDISEQGKIFLQAANVNDQKMREVTNQLSVLNQAEKYVRSKTGSGTAVPSMSGLPDPTLPGLVDKLYNLELEKESLKKTTGENSSTMISLADRIDKIKPSILENIESQRTNLEVTSRNIALTNQSYASLLQSMPQKERDLIEINRDLSTKNSVYTYLLQKREETVLSNASTPTDSRTIDKAQSASAPVAPKPKVIYFSAFLSSLIVCIIFIAMRENFGSKIMFRKEIQLFSKATIIGEISANTSNKPIVIRLQDRTFIAEQFRRIRTSLQFIGINPKNNRLLVTSAISGEGKSFVSLNLAITIALTGKKVVLIDADLHNPSLQQKLNIVPEKGLSEFLSGNADDENIIVPSMVNNDLFFISAGKLPQNPSELLMNSRMTELLDLLDGQFDFIVIDSAPVGLVTDAYVLSPLCDATVFVIRHKYTPKAVVAQMDEENSINELKNIGIVFNDVHSRGFGGDQYGSGYGKGYIYEDRKYYQLNKSAT